MPNATKSLRSILAPARGKCETKSHLTNTRTDCALTQQMMHRLHQGHQPLREERTSAKLLLDLHTVSAPSGEERTLGAAAHRWNALRYASAASAAHPQPGVYGGCAAEAGVSEASGSRVSGCPRALRDTLIQGTTWYPVKKNGNTLARAARLKTTDTTEH